MFTYHSKRNGAVMTVSYVGSITENYPPPMPEFGTAISSAVAGVILDLSNVEYINSVGVSSLMATFKMMRNENINVVICSPNPHVFKVLKLARTELLVPISDTRSSASEMLSRIMANQTKPQREYILVVQGKLEIQKELRDILRQTRQESNYNVVTSLSASRAWTILGGKNIQLVILDVTVPGKEGQHLLKRVRTNRDLKGLPFLIASDDKNLVNAAYYTQNGADDIIRFPFNPYETPVRLRTALSLFYNWHTIAELQSQSEPHRSFMRNTIRP